MRRRAQIRIAFRPVPGPPPTRSGVRVRSNPARPVGEGELVPCASSGPSVKR